MTHYSAPVHFSHGTLKLLPCPCLTPITVSHFCLKKRISGTVKDWWQSLAKRDTGTYIQKSSFFEKNKIRELPETKPPSRQCNHKAYPRCRCHSSQRESSRACVITIYGITHMVTLCWYVVVKTHCVCVQVVPFEKIEARPLLEYDGCLVNPSVLIFQEWIDINWNSATKMQFSLRECVVLWRCIGLR